MSNKKRHKLSRRKSLKGKSKRAVVRARHRKLKIILRHAIPEITVAGLKEDTPKPELTEEELAYRRHTRLVAKRAGIVVFFSGVSLFGFIAGKEAYSEYKREQLLQEAVSSRERYILYSPEDVDASSEIDLDNVSATSEVVTGIGHDQEIDDVKSGKLSISIPDLDIKAPILEGVGDDVLDIAVGHFPETSNVGQGNFSLAGHSSEIYDCVFNNLKDVELGMKIIITGKKGKEYEYHVTENFVVEPTAVWVLNEFGDNRVTIVTCTEGGARRQIVVAQLMTEEEYKKYIYDVNSIKQSVILDYSDNIGGINVSEYFNNEEEVVETS